MVTIAHVPRPDPGDAASHPWLTGLAAVDLAASREAVGHDDFAVDAPTRAVLLQGSAYHLQDAWVALAGDEVVGYAWAERPQREDLDTATVEVRVRADVRRRGIGTALLTTVAEFLAADGRTTLLAYTLSPDGASGADAVAARSGTGAVDARLPGNAYVLRHGFTLEQIERFATLTLSPAVLDRADALGRRAASGTATDYEVVGWEGPCPDAFADGLAALAARMSTDVPMADELNEPQEWDAERLRASEQRRAEAGRGWVTTAVRHRRTGLLAAFTELAWRRNAPQGVSQGDTLVHADHRGRRLGMLVKAANVRRLLAANPDAARIHTWNAAENTHMLAINDALGFVPRGWEGVWRRRP